MITKLTCWVVDKQVLHSYTLNMDYLFVKDFEFAREALELSLEQLCARLGMNRSYVSSVLNGAEKPGPRLLEAFYSYAYNKGLRMNRGKEELYHEQFGSRVLYHGSYDGLTMITHNGSRADCDFGAGFYLGESYHQASSFIADAKQGSVYAFRFDADSLKGVSFHTDLDWMLLICYFRGKLKAYQEHPKLQRILQRIEGVDYIRAPIADNKMFQVMRLFGDGDITSEEALHALSASNLGEQIILKTDKAVQALTFLERFYLSEPEKQYLLSFTAERASEVETKLKIAKREFRTQGKYIDEVFS